MMNAGEDCTDEFASIHSTKAWDMLTPFYIGEVGSSKDTTPIQITAPPPAPKIALNPKKWVPLKLRAKTEVGPNLLVLRLALPLDLPKSGIPTGWHVFLRYTNAAMSPPAVMRAYTPISLNSDQGFLEFAIKVYPWAVMKPASSTHIMMEHIDVTYVDHTPAPMVPPPFD